MSMKKNKAVLLLSGYNPRAVIAFCRWATQHNVHFHLIASGKRDPVFLTEYANQVEIIRETKDLNIDLFLAWIKTLVERYEYQQVLILPSTEYFNRFILKNRADLEGAGCIVPLVEEALYEEISDKFKFADLCRSSGLAVPKEFSTPPDVLPFVAKPRSYFSSEGTPLYPHLVLSHQDRDTFLKKDYAKDYFFQEFVVGENHYLLACIQKDGTALTYSQENLIQQSQGKSMILARASQYHESENAKKYLDLLIKVGFYGLIMIEIRRTDRDKYVMVEANPRLWGPIQYIVDNGIDFFGMLLRDHGFEIKNTHKNKTGAAYYYWSGGITPKSQPVSYHHFSAEEFLEALYDIRKDDIFLREDTMDLYLYELGLIESVYE